MRHRNKRSKLGMKTSHRKATLRNIAKSLLEYQRIEISIARAKEVRKLVEHLITLSKDNTVNSRRRAFDIMTDRDMVGMLFNKIAPLFANRSSGYTRIIPIGWRRGDGANMCVIELTERTIVEKAPKKKKAKHEEAAHGEAITQEEKSKAGEAATKEEKHKEPKKHKPTLDEEKSREKAKSEDRKLADKKGFMKNLRGLFRKRGDF